MATETGFLEAALKIAGAIHGYARARHWGLEDYHIFMAFNPDYYTLRTTVVAKAFEDRTEAQESADYNDVMDGIERALGKRRVFNYYSLVLTGMNGYSFSPYPREGTPEVEIDEALINKGGVSWSEPFRQGSH